ncbi:MAG: peptidylprolyl isomerase [Alphaproteobacteria bacterium]|nr:peptidylprolyl isomerase [Alphaproteobacteria bacterium]
MSKMLRVATLALALGALALPAVAADKPATASPTEDLVVARVNGEPIMRSDVVRELQSMGSQAANLPPQMIYPQLLEKAIVTKMVSAKGYAEKLQNDKEVKERVKDAEAQIVADAYIRKTVAPKITEDKIKARYNELSAKFKPEDEVRARHILVPTESEAKDLLKQIKDGADFAKLATDKSKDTGSAKQGGDLGYFPRSAMVKPFAEAAFGMKVGDISEKPVKSDFGYHIIKIEDRRKSSPPPLSEVKDQLRNQVGQEIVGQVIKDMEAKAKVERFNFDGTPMKVKADKKEDKK